MLSERAACAKVLPSVRTIIHTSGVTVHRFGSCISTLGIFITGLDTSQD